jgi:epoxyqueuosine reductase
MGTKYVVDGSKCISYFTIELKEEIPAEVKGKFQNWIFGCDICQEVCPWNRFAKPHQQPRFDRSPELQSFTNDDWRDLTEDVFRKVFRNSPVKRTRYEGIMRNIRFLED